MKKRNDLSWGRYNNVDVKLQTMTWRNNKLPLSEDKQLPYGNGRSYGDSCLNDQGSMIDGKKLDHFIDFDTEQGLLKVEAGVLLSSILALIVPADWFIPASPGTKFVTVGGAIANDVHGKNHHVTGTFGCNISQFELLRSDGKRLLCSPTENQDYFAATIGGLGLTGMITWAEIRLKPINNPFINCESIKYNSLAEFMSLSEESATHYEYTVAWVDCLATGDKLGKGHFIRGNHADSGVTEKQPSPPKSHLSVPFSFPNGILNGLTVNMFNTLYYNRQFSKIKASVSHYDPFFYPLDSILDWNRIYGSRGFFQYQCVVPKDDHAMREIMQSIAKAKVGSFLTVLKEFGDIKSPGMLSFPRSGMTFALDFPNQGARTLALLERLDDIVKDAKGAVYPAKDARMSAESFQQYYPNWEEFSHYIDPKFSSSFWRRVTGVE
ncbi:MAG: FAD-binding oxidoreductase [Pseudomonadales bacterium]|nr:FAD-binding oxidoreductase [Pseudomonadales bacterium]